jgi:hypothetical protein
MDELVAMVNDLANLRMISPETNRSTNNRSDNQIIEALAQRSFEHKPNRDTMNRLDQ